MLSKHKGIKSETKYTPWGDGFHSWNGAAAEVEFVEFVAAFVKMMCPQVIIETGVGLGYTTSIVLTQCSENCRYICVEHDPSFIEKLPIKDKRVEICQYLDDFSLADIIILDSKLSYRIKEIEQFVKQGKNGAVCLVHDVSKRHKEHKAHVKFYKACQASGLPHIFLNNPRGSCILHK